MKGLKENNTLFTMIVAIISLVGLATADSAVICDDNFDNYRPGDVYTSVNPWGWTNWVRETFAPTVRAEMCKTPPNSLTGPMNDPEFRGQYYMQLTLYGNDVLCAANGGGDVSWSITLRGTKPYRSPLLLQLGTGGVQDRVCFSVGGNNSSTFKYRGFGNTWHEIFDFDGNPLVCIVYTWYRIELRMLWDPVRENYGWEYRVQIFDENDEALSPVTTCTILDANRNDGVIKYINWFGLSAATQNHCMHIDNMKIVSDEPFFDLGRDVKKNSLNLLLYD